MENPRPPLHPELWRFVHGAHRLPHSARSHTGPCHLASLFTLAPGVLGLISPRLGLHEAFQVGRRLSAAEIDVVLGYHGSRFGQDLLAQHENGLGDIDDVTGE